MSRFSEALFFLLTGLVLSGPMLADPPPAVANHPGTTAPALARYLHPEFGNAYAFSPANDGSLAVAIPVSAEPNVDLKTLEPRILDVANGTMHLDRLCIEARIEMPDHATPELVITAKCPTMRPAAYTGTVE